MYSRCFFALAQGQGSGRDMHRDFGSVGLHVRHFLWTRARRVILDYGCAMFRADLRIRCQGSNRRERVDV